LSEIPFYNLVAKKISGEDFNFDSLQGKVVIIVNTASKCGFTPQFAELEELYKKYQNNGLEILGFPCNQFLAQDPAANSEISEFCTLNYGVTFPMFEKIDVNGAQTHPVFQFLKKAQPGLLGSQKIKWNFTKFLIDPAGNCTNRFAPNSSPFDMESMIKEYLKI
jgi:glutathione peroxidase-family protein